jgi:hypothetical protein
MVPLGMGLGLIMPVVVVAVQNATGREDLGTATSSNVFFRSMGSSFGVAVLGAILDARLAYWFPRLVPALPGGEHVSSQSVAFSPRAVRHLPGPVKHGIIDAFAHSLHTVFLWAAPIAALTLPFILLMRELPLRNDVYIRSASMNPMAEGAAEELEAEA